MRKIDLMHSLFGKDEDHQCKDCSNLVTWTYQRKYFKCACYGESCSESTDWRKKWTACGLFNKEYNGTPAVRLARPERKKDEQIEGQVSLFDGCKDHSR